MLNYKVLNEVLIEWNESPKEDSDNIILSAKDIAVNLGNSSSWEKIGKKYIEGCDILMYFNGPTWDNFAWLTRYTGYNNVMTYIPAYSGLNFLSWEAKKCIEWVELIIGEAGQKTVHIDYPDMSSFSWRDSELTFTVSSADFQGCGKIKYSIDMYYDAANKIWFPCLLYKKPQSGQSEWWMQKMGKWGNLPVFHAEPLAFSNLGVTKETAVPDNWREYEINPEGYTYQTIPFMVRIKFKSDPWGWLRTGSKIYKGMGTRYAGPAFLFLGKYFDKIPDYAFSTWDNLIKIGADHPLNYIGSSAFEKTYLNELNLPGTKSTAFNNDCLLDIKVVKYWSPDFWINNSSLAKEYANNPKETKKKLCGRQRKLNLKFF